MKGATMLFAGGAFVLMLALLLMGSGFSDDTVVTSDSGASVSSDSGGSSGGDSGASGGSGDAGTPSGDSGSSGGDSGAAESSPSSDTSSLSESGESTPSSDETVSTDSESITTDSSSDGSELQPGETEIAPESELETTTDESAPTEELAVETTGAETTEPEVEATEEPSETANLEAEAETTEEPIIESSSSGSSSGSSVSEEETTNSVSSETESAPESETIIEEAAPTEEFDAETTDSNEPEEISEEAAPEETTEELAPAEEQQGSELSEEQAAPEEDLLVAEEETPEEELAPVADETGRTCDVGASDTGAINSGALCNTVLELQEPEIPVEENSTNESDAVEPPQPYTHEASVSPASIGGDVTSHVTFTIPNNGPGSMASITIQRPAGVNPAFFIDPSTIACPSGWQLDSAASSQEFAVCTAGEGSGAASGSSVEIGLDAYGTGIPDCETRSWNVLSQNVEGSSYQSSVPLELCDDAPAHTHTATVSPTTVEGGSTVTLTYTITNNGPGDVNYIRIQRPSGNPSFNIDEDTILCPDNWHRVPTSSDNTQAVCEPNEPVLPSYYLSQSESGTVSFEAEMDSVESCQSSNTKVKTTVGQGDHYESDVALEICPPEPQTGTLIIQKNTEGGDGTFDFTSEGLGPFQVTTEQGSGQQEFAELEPGDYSVTEADLPDGWSFTGLQCSDGVITDGTEAIFNLEAGQTLSCDYTNSYESEPELFPRACGAQVDLCDWDVQLPYGSQDLSQCNLQYNTEWPVNTDATATCTFDGSQFGSHTLYFSIDNDVVECTLNGVPFVQNFAHENCALQDPRSLQLSTNGTPNSFALSPVSGTNTIICTVRDRGVQSFFDACVVGEGEPHGTLTVIKEVINDDIGTASADEFTISVDAESADPSQFPGDAQGTEVTLGVGDYSVSEEPADGYETTYSEDCSGTIANGEEKRCLVTNDDIAPPVCDPQQELIANGGFENPIVTNGAKWDIFPDGTSGLEWSVAWMPGPATYNSVSRPEIASLELHRNVLGPAYEGQQYTELDGDWEGPSSGLNGEPASTRISQTIPTVPGRQYTLSFAYSPRQSYPASDNVLEVSAGGNVLDTISIAGSGSNSWTTHSYTFTASSSTTVVQFSDLGTQNSLGTFVDDVSLRCFVPPDPVLTVVKHMINDDTGTMVASDFTVHVYEEGDVEGSPQPGSEQGTTYTLYAGNFQVAEDEVVGYSPTFSGDCDADGNVVLAAGDEKTCVITNDDLPPLLCGCEGGEGDLYADCVDSYSQGMRKDGTPVVAARSNPDAALHAPQTTGQQFDFPNPAETTFFATGFGGTVTLCFNNEVENGPGNDLHVYETTYGPGTSYPPENARIEGSADGYTYVELSPSITRDSDLELDLGPLSSMRFIRITDVSNPADFSGSQYSTADAYDVDAVAALPHTGTLTVYKEMMNDNSGTATADQFPIHVQYDDGEEMVDVEGSPQPGDEEGTTYVLEPGTYFVSEDGMQGYASSISQNCVEGVTLEAGGEASCTITNDDMPATLIVTKHVDNGEEGELGDAIASDFTIYVYATNPSPSYFPGDEEGTEVSLDAGEYGLSESGSQGYAASSEGDCSGPIANGETKYCTITNRAQLPGTIIVKKDVLGPNEEEVSDSHEFWVSLDGGEPVSFSELNDATFPGVTPGSDHELTESEDGSYFLSDPVPVTVPEDDTVEVTINNTQKFGTITIVKETEGGDGTFDFTGLGGQEEYYQTETWEDSWEDGFQIETEEGSGSQEFSELDPGLYTITEQVPEGWYLTGIECSEGAQASIDGATVQITLGSDESVTCTYSDAKKALLTVTKVVVNNDGKLEQPSHFQLLLNGEGILTGVQNSLEAGAYVISEVPDDGYVASFSGDCDENGNVALLPGDVKSCTITNDDKQSSNGGGNNNGGGNTFIPAPQLFSSPGQQEEPEIGFASNNTTNVTEPPVLVLAPIGRAPLWEIPAGNETSPVAAPAAAALFDFVPAWLWAICPLVIAALAFILLWMMRKPCPKCKAMSWPWAKKCSKCGAKLT